MDAYSIPYKRKKKPMREGKTFRLKLFTQFLIAALIFAVFLSIKDTDTSFAHLFCEGVRWVILEDIDFEEIYKDIGKPTSNVEEDELDNNFLEDSSLITQEESSDQQRVLPASTVIEGYDFCFPMEGFISTDYGLIAHPLEGEVFHCGIDIAAYNREIFKAVMGGTVVETGISRNYGNFIVLNHEYNIKTVYGHVSEFFVQKGQIINKEEQIGCVYGNDRLPASHLHFEMWIDGNAVNPVQYIGFP